MNVSLCEIGQENYRAAAALSVAPEQNGFVVNNALALAATAFDPGHMPLGIVADERQAMVGLLVHGLEAATGRWWLHHLMLDATQQQRGYGQRALNQLAAQLQATPSVKQLYASYHPANEAAARLAARLGFSATKEMRDDQIVVVLTLPSRTSPPLDITLRDVTLENARAVINLNVAPAQARFVASNAASLIQSKFEPHWLTKAIYNGQQLVGFTMYGYDPDYGWGVLRLMIDAAYQGLGYGRAAMHAVIAEIRAAGGTSVGLGYDEDNAVARRFYSGLGFVETGEQPFGQPFAVLQLNQDNP